MEFLTAIVLPSWIIVNIVDSATSYYTDFIISTAFLYLFHAQKIYVFIAKFEDTNYSWIMFSIFIILLFLILFFDCASNSTCEPIPTVDNSWLTILFKKVMISLTALESNHLNPYNYNNELVLIKYKNTIKAMDISMI